MARYLITGPEEFWPHKFEDGTTVHVRFVFDLDRLIMLAADIRPSDGGAWSRAQKWQLQDLRDSLVNANLDALERPAEYGLVARSYLPDWASAVTYEPHPSPIAMQIAAELCSDLADSLSDRFVVAAYLDRKGISEALRRRAMPLNQELLDVIQGLSDANRMLDRLAKVSDRVSWYPEVSFSRGEMIRVGFRPSLTDSVVGGDLGALAAPPPWPDQALLQEATDTLTSLNKRLADFFRAYKNSPLAHALDVHRKAVFDDELRLALTVSAVQVSYEAEDHPTEALGWFANEADTKLGCRFNQEDVLREFDRGHPFNRYLFRAGGATKQGYGIAETLASGVDPERDAVVCFVDTAIGRALFAASLQPTAPLVPTARHPDILVRPGHSWSGTTIS